MEQFTLGLTSDERTGPSVPISQHFEHYLINCSFKRKVHGWTEMNPRAQTSNKTERILKDNLRERNGLLCCWFFFFNPATFPGEIGRWGGVSWRQKKVFILLQQSLVHHPSFARYYIQLVLSLCLRADTAQKKTQCKHFLQAYGVWGGKVRNNSPGQWVWSKVSYISREGVFFSPCYLQRDKDCKVVGLPSHCGTGLISGSK